MTEQCGEPGCEMLAGHAGEWHSGQLSNAVVDWPATRPEPGTPLPWIVVEELDGAWFGLRSADKQQGIGIYDSEPNVRYIVYAANKLPELEADRARLVAMLKQVGRDEGLATDHELWALVDELEEKRADG